MRKLLTRLLRRSWRPPRGMPPLEAIRADIERLDGELEKRPWLAGRVGVDAMQTNFLVNAIASLLVTEIHVPKEMIDWYLALTEHQSKTSLEEQSRSAPQRAPRVIVPGRDA